MTTIEKIFDNRVNELLENSTEKTIFFFKGFSKKQILRLINHERSILNSNDIIDANGDLSISVLNEKWIEMIQNISIAQKSLVGFYEELIAIKDFLPRVKVDKVIKGF